jgi:hypothetical protein
MSERHIPLTAGNLKNGHFYLRQHLDFFPDDAIGGTNRREAGVPVTVKFQPGAVVETDLAGGKHLFFRNRRATRDFFERTAAAEGDTVVVEKVAEREFLVWLTPRS